jgi:two-component system, OmpR family, response regulator
MTERARVDALARRKTLVDKQMILRAGKLELDLIERHARRGTEVIKLERKEFAVLEFLVRRTGQVVTRRMLYESVWKSELKPNSNAVEAYVRRLRVKLGERAGLRTIETVRGQGYRFNVWP